MILKLLIITESMMPFTSNWGACQRIYHYSKKMVSEGIDVTVICHNTANRIDSTEFVEGIKVIGYGGMNHHMFTDMQSGCGFKSGIRKKLKWIDRNVHLVSMIVRAVYRYLYSEPNVLSGRKSKQWAKTALPFVLRYIKDEKIDVVILSGPSFGFFHYAEELKGTGVKLILDYRDPWVSWYEKPTLVSSVEKKAVDNARLVLTTTEALTKALNEKYSTDKCHTIMNGYDKEIWDTIKLQEHDPSKLIISYIGSIRIHGQPGFRDATCFLKSVKKFKDAHPEVEVHFIGVQDDLKDINPKLKEYVEFQNTVPVETSLRLTAKSDVLLMFHTALDSSGKYIICGKAFDCLRSGNYVLSIGDVAYSNKDFVEKTGSGIHCANKEVAILNALEAIYKKWKKGELYNRNRNTVQYSREYQNAKLLRLIKSI